MFGDVLFEATDDSFFFVEFIAVDVKESLIKDFYLSSKKISTLFEYYRRNKGQTKSI